MTIMLDNWQPELTKLLGIHDVEGSELESFILELLALQKQSIKDEAVKSNPEQWKDAYLLGWNEALEAAMKINVTVDTDRLKMTHDEFRHFVNGIDELSKMINTLKK